MKISEIFKSRKAEGKPVFSIEIFPPKTPKGMESLKAKLYHYKSFSPDYISITYGALGSTQHGTLELSSWIEKELKITAMSHLTCVGNTRSELEAIIDNFHRGGVQNIMALRGDPPVADPNSVNTEADRPAFVPPENGLANASDLISLIKSRNGFSIGCAAYPEVHVEALSSEKDLDYLKLKIENGAEFIVSQFFLDNVYFLRFRDSLKKNGINVPLAAGILPISNYSQVTRFAIMCGCTIPAKVMRGLKGKTDADQEAYGLDHSAEQVQELLKEGVDGIHIYALNKKNAVDRLLGGT